ALLFVLTVSCWGNALQREKSCKPEGYCVTFNEDEIRAEVGLCAVIPCAFTSLFAPKHIIWYKCDTARCYYPEIIFHSDKNKENIQPGFKGRVSLVEPDVAQKNCSIIINDLKESDSGSYRLRIEGKATGEAFSYEEKPTLLVTELNQKPSVMIPMTEGQQVTLTCTAPGLCSGSPPNITWMWRGKGENDSFIKGNITALKTENLTRHSSTLSFNPSAKHNNTNVICKVSFPGNITREESVSLNVSCKYVLYLSEIQCFFQFYKYEVVGKNPEREGDDLNLTCSVDSFPPTVIGWSKSTKQAEHQSHNLTKVHGRHEICHQDTSTIFLFSITNVTAKDAGLYICTAKYPNYTLREEINVTVKCV
uniref:Ig-like domain-containing protein n=1 Tax=Poecilia latipinna TaxID=48699 RepID=A0A3B3TY62_9TELE